MPSRSCKECTSWFCLLLLAAAARVSCCAELSLDEAVQLALQNNVDVANSKLDISKSQHRSKAYRSLLFPKLSTYILGSEQLVPFSFTIPQGTLGKIPGIGPIPGQDTPYTTAIQPTGFAMTRVAQPLSGIYRTRLTLKSLDFSTLLADQKSRGKRQDVVRDVKQIYYNIEQLESSLAAGRETVKLYEEVQRFTADNVSTQTALQSDLLQAQANLAEVELSQVNLANQEANQKEQLNDLIGRDVLTEFTVTRMERVGTAQVDLLAARARALTQRPEIQQSHLKVLQSQEEVRAKRAEYIPELSAEFNSVSLMNFNSFLPSGTYSIGLSLSWEPFDWGRRKYEIAEKRDTVAQDKNNEAAARRKVIMDVDDKYRKLQQNWSKLQVAGLTQQAAIENLRVNNNQYEVQNVLLKVVLQAQNTLAQANSEYQHGLADYWTARADFDHALGDDQ